MAGNAKLVHSIESGRVCPTCGKPAKSCSCKWKKATTQNKINLDGIIHIRREKKGRKGKTVTTISGFNEISDGLKQIAKRLKNKCGTGGSAKRGVS
jgi:translation initiation factor 1